MIPFLYRLCRTGRWGDLQLAALDIFGAIAKALFCINCDPVIRLVADQSVEAIASAGGKVDAQQGDFSTCF